MKNIKGYLWKIGVFVYRLKWVAPLVRLIPYGLKQKIRLLVQPPDLPPAPGPVFSKGLVTIIVPVYNHAEYLEQCLRSACSQTYRQLEVIVVDDASPDPRVRAVLAGFAGDRRVRIYYNQENLGISGTQNRALVESQGEYVAFLDCDDYLHPEAVAASLACWDETTVYSHSARINVDPAGQEVNRISFEHLPRQDYFAENLERMYATHFKIIRRTAFARVGLFDRRFDSAQDYDMLMRIAFHYPSTAFIFVPNFVYYHRLHQRQATETMNAHQLANTELIQREARLRKAISRGEFDRFLSIIMLSYGKHSQTLRAVQSLAATVAVPHEIILFDNGSGPETVQFIRENIEGRFPTVKVIYHDRNLGPAVGRREALRQARGDYFLVFDNDERAEPGWLEELLVRAASNPRAGMICCKVAFPDESLQFSGGYISRLDDELIELGLFDRGRHVNDLEAAGFRECDWCPIGATLFTVNPAAFLHDGYTNAFEDAGISMAIKRQGLQLLNSPASLVWHDHMLYQGKLEMGEKYIEGRYNPVKMLSSVASFYRENGMIIKDDYVWRENRLEGLPREELRSLLRNWRGEADLPN